MAASLAIVLVSLPTGGSGCLPGACDAGPRGQARPSLSPSGRWTPDNSEGHMGAAREPSACRTGTRSGWGRWWLCPPRATRHIPTAMKGLALLFKGQDPLRPVHRARSLLTATPLVGAFLSPPCRCGSYEGTPASEPRWQRGGWPRVCWPPAHRLGLPPTPRELLSGRGRPGPRGPPTRPPLPTATTQGLGCPPGGKDLGASARWEEVGGFSVCSWHQTPCPGLPSQRPHGEVPPGRRRGRHGPPGTDPPGVCD